MARRIPVREMLRLRASGLSATAIARAQPVSKTSVVDTFHAADEKGVAWECFASIGFEPLRHE